MFFGKKELWLLLGGYVGGEILKKTFKTKAVRNLAVAGVAKGIQLKEDFQEKYDQFKEEVADLHEEAKRKAEEDSRCHCGCDEEEIEIEDEECSCCCGQDHHEE